MKLSRAGVRMQQVWISALGMSWIQSTLIQLHTLLGINLVVREINKITYSLAETLTVIHRVQGTSACRHSVKCERVE